MFLNRFFEKITFRSKRLVYKGEALGSRPEEPKLSLADAARLSEAARKAREEAIKKGVEAGKTQAQGQSPEKKELPPLPDKFQGFHFDKGKSSVDQDSKTIKQPFEFGDSKLSGTVTLPQNPDEKAKTTYVFNYVDDPSKLTPESQKKLLAELQKRKADLGNTVVVTLKTPRGETTIDGKKVDTMQALMANLEKFQQEHPELKGKLPRPDLVLHMTNPGESEKVTKLLGEYYQKSQDQKDPRLTRTKTIINSESLEDTLSNAIKDLQKPAEPAPDQPAAQPAGPEVPSVTPGGGAPRSPSGPVGGGAGGGSYGGGAGGAGKSGGDGSPAKGSGSDSGSGKPTVGPKGQPSETKENSPELAGKVLFIGDSLLTATQKSVEATQKYTKVRSTEWGEKETVQVSKSVVRGDSSNPSMVSIIQELAKESKPGAKDSQLDKQKPDKLLVLGGTNDLLGNREKVLEGLKTIWKIAKEHGIKVFACTIPPVNKDGQYFKGTYEKANENRHWINEEILKLVGQGDGPDQVIKLHLPLSEGGMADEKGPNDNNGENLERLHPDMKATDGLHPSAGIKGKGTDLMAMQIQKVVGQGKASPSAPPEATGASEGIAVEPSERKAADEWLAEIKKTPNPASFIGQTRPLPGGQKILKVAWHQNHEGQWGTPSYKPLPGTHVGVQVEAAPGVKLAKAPSKPKNQGKNPESGPLPSAEKSSERFAEKEIRTRINGGKVDLLVNMPEKINPDLPTKVVIYATPNGGNPDRSKGMGDLIGAQTRMAREQNSNENLIVAYITPPGNKWPEYPGQGKNIYEEIQGIIQQQSPGQPVSYSIDGMSGGGSYQFNIINQHNEIPDEINQFTFFDSIYSYNSIHAQKLKRWLDRDKNHKLVGISGTLVGTQQKIMDDLGKLGVNFTQSEENKPWVTYKGMDGQISFVEMSRGIHGPTVDNKGFAYAHTLDSSGTSSYQVYAGVLNRKDLPPEFASRVA